MKRISEIRWGNFEVELRRIYNISVTAEVLSKFATYSRNVRNILHTELEHQLSKQLDPYIDVE